MASGHAIASDSPAVELIADVKRFEVRTDTTLAYWDVIGEVAIWLSPTSSFYESECVERTYVNPGKQLVTDLMSKCLAEIGKQFSSDARVARVLAEAKRE